MNLNFMITRQLTGLLILILYFYSTSSTNAQTLAFPDAEGFGRYATGARGSDEPEIYIVTNLNDSGAGSFRDAVSKSGRFVVFAVGGTISLESRITIPPNTTLAGQTALGQGITLYGNVVSFSGSSNTIARYLKIRLGTKDPENKNDASGISNGSNIILDHMSFSWGLDEVFSINWDKKGPEPDSITIQNSIISQGLHKVNHSAGGLIQTEQGKISLLRNLFISNKTRNPKVKGINEFVNNVVYNYGNVTNTKGHKVSGDGYIMGGSAGVSKVNIINNYFIAGPLTPSQQTPFSRGTPTFFLHASGNYFDVNKNSKLDGELIPENPAGYPGIPLGNFKDEAFNYPKKSSNTAAEAFSWIIDSVGANYPERDQVDKMLISELKSLGTKGRYLFTEFDLPFAFSDANKTNTNSPIDTDGDGIPDSWEEQFGLDKNDKDDALSPNQQHPQYLNIEVYINSLTKAN